MKWQAALLAPIVRFADNQSGQALREYALVIAVVAVTTVTALAALGLAIPGSLPVPFDGLLETLKKVHQQP